ncbi:MAG: pyridoxal-phosphate dependent enzyme [Gemmatimonadota bacterium]|nr:pyridoxal-phosphate dependent enzyme [Gemmatimonadota bacterium]
MLPPFAPIDVFLAAKRLRGVVTRTPLRRSEWLSRLAGGDVWLKLENEQVTGSFKIRGAYNMIATLPAEVRARGVIASSAGNHGMGVAYAARAFSIPATIFVPATAPDVKRRGIEALGAVLDGSAPDYDAALALALRAAREREATFVHPCLGAQLFAGQGTIALEILEQLPDVATVVLPIGGAGLLGGVGNFLRAVALRVHIAGAQSVNTAAMARSLAAGSVVSIPSVLTLADGLAGGIDDVALETGRLLLDEIAVVEESEIESAIAAVYREEGAVIEGSGAAGIAAVVRRPARDVATPAVVIVTGRNIDPARHDAIIATAGG